MVTQRVNSAKLLMDNESEWSSIGRGLVVYVSFTKHAEEKDCESVAKKLLNLPVMTMGKWGDGSPCKSIAKMCREFEDPVYVMVIPQAGLTSKYKSKRLQYHSQMPKEKGRAMYKTLCDALQKVAVDLIFPGVAKKAKRQKKRDRKTETSGTPADASTKDEESKTTTTTDYWTSVGLSTSQVEKMPRFVFGTFGNRQALHVVSDMGPFTHSFAFA